MSSYVRVEQNQENMIEGILLAEEAETSGRWTASLWLEISDYHI